MCPEYLLRPERLLCMYIYVIYIYIDIFFGYLSLPCARVRICAAKAAGARMVDGETL